MSESTTIIKGFFYVWYFVVSYAWVAYFVMGIYWIIDRKINKKYVLSAHYPVAISAALLVGSIYGAGYIVWVNFHIYKKSDIA